MVTRVTLLEQDDPGQFVGEGHFPATAIAVYFRDVPLSPPPYTVLGWLTNSHLECKEVP